MRTWYTHKAGFLNVISEADSGLCQLSKEHDICMNARVHQDNHDDESLFSIFLAFSIPGIFREMLKLPKMQS